MAIASAVIVPESVEQPGSPTGPTKRRKSSVSEENVKRPRLTSQNVANAASPFPLPVDRASEKRKSGHLEERKRGQRLFGALLGTLSQSSSSTAQKCRTDIERKQQAKLKLQADEVEEKKKLRLHSILEFRRREQKKYDKQSMQIRHSNLLAQAQFLKTKAEPGLYYKPWELLPDEEDRIKAQIQQAERDIERETEHFEADNPLEKPQVAYEADEDRPTREEEEAQPDPSDTVGSNTDKAEKPLQEESSNTNIDDSTEPVKTEEPPEASKDHNDDGGEVVEGEEDTVIY